VKATTLAVAPVLLPVATSIVGALLADRPRLQRLVGGIGAVALLAAAVGLLLAVEHNGTVHVSFGGWAPPFGIEFAVDRLAAIMVLATAVTGALCLLFLASGIENPAPHPLLAPQVHGVLAGVCGAFLTADLFNLYVWMELTLIAVLGLFVVGGKVAQLDAAFRYMVLNLVGTVLLLMAVGFAYGATGFLNFTAVGTTARDLAPGVLVPVLGALVLAFLVKAGAFPFLAWLPASYHTLPAPILALFAALLTKVGVYALLRMMGDVFAPAPTLLLQALGWIGAVTMLVGALGAARHGDVRRVIVWLIVSAVGFILVGIAVSTPGAQAATLVYIVHDIAVKAGLVLVTALVVRHAGTHDLRRMGGLWAARPGLAVLFLVLALSVFGMPPFSGFWAKLFLLREIIAKGHTGWLVMALVASLFTLYAMGRVWIEAFWKDAPKPHTPTPAPRLGLAWVAASAFAALTVAIGVAPEMLVRYALDAAATLGIASRS
jgi:multicomponent Na+:H+ antiporter subunit D